MATSKSDNPTEVQSSGTNYLKRAQWLLLSLPLTATLWGALPSSLVDTQGPVFQLMITLICAYIIGSVIALIPRIPPLLGMMLAGAFLRNMGYVSLPQQLAAGLRSLALAIILLRAGLGLDLSVLKKLSGACVRLTFMPCFAEAVSVMVVSHFLLGLPYLWGLLLGFVLAAVSPAVVVPAMIDLMERRLGTEKGIPTLVMAAASFDDVAAITGFGVILGIIFSSNEGGSILLTVFAGPLEAIAGLLIGCLFGAIVAFFLSARRMEQNSFDLLSPLYLLFLGCAGIFIGNKLNVGGVGPLAAITISAAAVVVWKKQSPIDSPPEEIVPIRSCDTVFRYLWVVFEPVLFSMIGLEIQFQQLKLSTVGYGALTLFICLTLRCCVTFLAVSCSVLNVKEKLFVCVSWLPKATVQAALAPTALDMARNWKSSGKELEDSALSYSETLLTVGVLAIMITAPIGAVGMSILAPRLLKQERPQPKDEQQFCESLTQDEENRA